MKNLLGKGFREQSVENLERIVKANENNNFYNRRMAALAMKELLRRIK